MKYQYFGVVVRSLGTSSGEILGLARADGGESHPTFDPRTEFEPDGHVFVRQLPDSLKSVPVPVTFDAELNPKPGGRDRMCVSHGMDGKPRLEVFGYAIFDATESLEDSRDLASRLRRTFVCANGLHFYLRHSSRLRGPWTARDGVLSAPGTPREWNDISWAKDSHFRADDGAYEVLLRGLDPTLGKPIDSITDADLAAWFIKTAQDIPELVDAVASLHRKGASLLKARIRALGKLCTGASEYVARS